MGASQYLLGCPTKLIYPLRLSISLSCSSTPFCSAPQITESQRIQTALQQAASTCTALQNESSSWRIAILLRLIDRVEVHPAMVRIGINITQLFGSNNCSESESKSPHQAAGYRTSEIQNKGVAPKGGEFTRCDSNESPTHWVEVPVTLKRIGMAMRMVIHAEGHPTGRTDPKLLAMIGKAHDWFERLSSGRCRGFTEIARIEKVTSPYVIRVMHLAFLAPDIIKRFQSGNYPTNLNCDRLTRLAPFPLDWQEQRVLLGMVS